MTRAARSACFVFGAVMLLLFNSLSALTQPMTDKPHFKNEKKTCAAFMVFEGNWAVDVEMQKKLGKQDALFGVGCTFGADDRSFEKMPDMFVRSLEKRKAEIQMSGFAQLGSDKIPVNYPFLLYSHGGNLVLAVARRAKGSRQDDPFTEISEWLVNVAEGAKWRHDLLFLTPIHLQERNSTAFRRSVRD